MDVSVIANVIIIRVRMCLTLLSSCSDVDASDATNVMFGYGCV